MRLWKQTGTDRRISFVTYNLKYIIVKSKQCLALRRKALLAFGKNAR
jgi:hypothetical protein